MNAHRLLVILGATATLGGCSPLSLRLVDASVQKPGHVALYLAVDDDKGQPVRGLGAEHFRLYEDKKPVGPSVSRQLLQDPAPFATRHTLVLLDLSAWLMDPEERMAIEEAVNRFTERTSAHQGTAVYAFDGRAEIFPLRDFAASPGPVSLSSFNGLDPSSNLNGAVLKAVDVLKKQLARAPTPLRFGTLVVFTSGTDHAGRIPHRALVEVLQKVDFEIFTIGLGSEADRDDLREIGRSGTVWARSSETLGAEFDTIAERIERAAGRFYLLAYCSPARSGEHVLRIETVAPDKKKGMLLHRFRADGFGPGCEPAEAPFFDTHVPGVRTGGEQKGPRG